MLPVDEALQRIVQSVKVLGPETIPLLDGLNRILATNVGASMDLPPFSHSTVDGFAIRHQDVTHASREKGSLLRVVETISAGSIAKKAVRPGLAIRVMTGAPLPTGTDAVVKDEDTAPGDDGTALIEVKRPVVPMENVASAGENLRSGEVALRKGTLLRPGKIGILASLGIREVVVFRQPRVGLLSTGSELVGLEKSIGPGKIFASSFYLLLAKLRESGCSPLPLGVVRDERTDIRNRIRSGLRSDGIITIGGTRRGDSDWVKDVYREMDIHTEFDGVAMSPGRSFTFGLLKGKPVFSLPGSPTACLVAFEELVKPALMKMKGWGDDHGPSGPTIRINLEGKVSGKKGLRTYILARVILRDGELVALPTKRENRGSLMPVVDANGIIVLPEDCTEVGSGDQVDVRLVDVIV
jgi:molybdopterin molybdotransferase